MTDFNILIEDRQSIMDVAMQEYGDVEGIFLLMADNPDVIISLNTQLQPGDRLGIQQNPVSIEDTQVLDFMRDNNHRVVNGEVPPVGDYNNDYNDDYFN